MKIELQDLNHNAGLSHETPAFTAALLINGEPRGTVRNDGGGGCCFWSDPRVEREIDEYAATLPPMDFDGMKVPESAETLVFGLVYDAADEGVDPVGDSFREASQA